MLDSLLPPLLDNQHCVWWPFATHDGLATRVEGWLSHVRQRARTGVHCPTQQGDACHLLDEMRLFKDSHELDPMQRAATTAAAM